MQDLDIRPAYPGDYNALAKVWFDGWQSAGVTHPSDLPLPDLRIRLADYAVSRWDLYAASLDGSVVALLALVPCGHQLDQLFVAPAHQGCGIGWALMTFAKARLPAGMWLNTAERNLRAIAFYEAAGFAIEARFERPEYERFDVRMRWSPSPE